jgi:cephalosporin hydroxylase
MTDINIYWNDVPGWFDWQEIYNEVAITTPTGSTVVELGVAFGKSTLYLAQKIHESGKDIRIMSVDRWTPHPDTNFIWHDSQSLDPGERAAYQYAERHNGFFNSFLHNLYHSGLSRYVDIVRTDSVRASELFRNEKPYFVFVDAGHDYDEVAADIDAWWKTGPEWMAGHDYTPHRPENFPGVIKAVHEKWGQENVEFRCGSTWVARRSHIERNL